MVTSVSMALSPLIHDVRTKQVYAATLKTGEDVVIKVQKPGVAEVLKTDLGFMYITSKLVEVSDLVDSFRAKLP